ncbi:piggyBac transposable element-derived protein 4-like [Limulus polyphemus]|uniref:PiggyBac transposable element-derived protein 4-like n=1 Tax=Limulus polyphemus TaxID=6850 RepID=A0ABM1B2E3_LIMPO|nr:piggyBac transposable element-derived protein 4-like [Limulus polyphemus]
MPRERFLVLLQHLHFSASKDSSDKLYKIRDLLNLYKESFQSAYFPEKNICIDESLLLWKGRLGWKIYIPLKRARFGIKDYFLCESSTGYVYNFEVYTGKRTDLQMPPCATEIAPEYLNHSTKVVLHLTTYLLDKGFYLAMDNYYSLPPLFDFLVSHMTDAIGTLRKNLKEIPKEVSKAKLKKGQDITMYKGKLMVMQWRDKREVMMISTTHDAERKTVNEDNSEKSKPLMCIDYKKVMGGVDHMDQVISSYDAARSHLEKYYKKNLS